MKIRVYDDGLNKENPVIELSKMLTSIVKKSTIKSVSVQYSQALTHTGPLYGDFEIET